MFMVTSVVMAEVVADGGDSGDCCGVDGIVNRDDKADGSSDSGRGGGVGQHGDDPRLSQRLCFHPSLTLLTSMQGPGSDSRRHLPAGELERGKQYSRPQHHLGRLLQTGAHAEGKVGRGIRSPDPDPGSLTVRTLEDGRFHHGIPG